MGDSRLITPRSDAPDASCLSKLQRKPAGDRELIWPLTPLVGDLYPSAEVTGADLSPIQPPWVPTNVDFITDDIRDEWIFGDNLDFVHLREVLRMQEDPAHILSQAYKWVVPFSQ